MRFRTLAAAIVVSIPLAPVFAGDPSGPTISQFLKIRTPGQVRLAPDGSVYMRDWPDGVYQLYRRSPTEPITSQGKRLTDFPDGLSGYSISPDGKWVALSAAKGGDENTQIYLLDTATDQIKPVLQNPKVQYAVNTWLRDSSGFVYTANDASPRDFHIYRFDIASGKSTPLLARSGRWFCGDITDDATRGLVGEYRSISDSSIYELDFASGALTDLSAMPSEGTSSNQIVGYMPDERNVIFSSDFENGFVQLYVRDAREPSASPRPMLPGLKNQDLDEAQLNHERSILATVHNDGGPGTLRLFWLPEMKPVLFGAPASSVVGVSDMRGRNVVYTVSNANSPGIAYLQEVPEPGSKTFMSEAPITARMDSEPIDLSRFRLPELVKYTSFDGREIPAFVYLPQGAKKGTPIPFVVNFHGGPEGQHRPGFNATIQYLVSKGYGVMLPNVRGSTGYGREFHMLDNYKQRWDSVKDGVEAARWLIKEGYAEKGRIAAYGGSYGGFMAVATVIEGADVFGASVNVVGIVNMKTFLEQTAGYRQKLREVEYGPLSDPEFLLSVSPIMRIEEINVPMLIAHGLNDPRVPVGEAMQLAVGLQKRGYDPELLFFPDEGHGFAKLENRILFAERMVKFLDRHIGSRRQ